MTKKRNCVLISTHHRPLDGGALTVYDALARRSHGRMEILTATDHYLTGEEVAGWRDYDATVSYVTHRIKQVRSPMGVSWRKKPLAWGRGVIKAFFLRRAVMREILKLIEEKPFDSVCFGDLDAITWLITGLRKKTDIKLLIYTHGEEISQKAYSPKADAARREALTAVDSIITVSNFTAGLLQANYDIPLDKIFLCSNGVDLDVYNGNLPDNVRETLWGPQTPMTNTPMVFSCGRLVDRKGFDKLVESWPYVLRKVPDAHLFIGGSGIMRGVLEQAVQTLDLKKSVTFLGRVSDEELPLYYGAADVFCMPNRTMPDGDTEGFGLVFLEAAAMGTPSVGGRAGGAVDAIKDEETGLLVDGNDPEEIAAALVSLLTDHEKRRLYAKAAFEHARSQGWDHKAESLFKHIDAL